LRLSLPLFEVPEESYSGSAGSAHPPAGFTGRYDFMDIYEAPDDSTAHKVSLISRSEGAVAAESWPAMSYDQHLKLLEDVTG